MPRPLRIHVPGAFYHVTLRGNHRQIIFFSPANRTLLDELTAEILERFGARLHAYCWMTNHIHALIQVGDAPLGALILRIASRYARTVQRGLRTSGHLFERRYHAVLVDADEYLLELLRYIHLNPVRAGMVANPCDYQWSSHRTYLGTRTQRWVTTDFALSMLHADRERAIAAYRRFIESDSEAHSSPLTSCNPNDTRILGSDEFAARLLGAAWRPRKHITLEQLIEQACVRFDVTPTELSSRSTQRRLTEARAWIALEAIAERITSLSHVARTLQRDESSLREAVKRRFERQSANPRTPDPER